MLGQSSLKLNPTSCPDLMTADKSLANSDQLFKMTGSPSHQVRSLWRPRDCLLLEHNVGQSFRAGSDRILTMVSSPSPFPSSITVHRLGHCDMCSGEISLGKEEMQVVPLYYAFAFP